MFEVLGLTDEIFRWAAFPEALEMRDSITGETVVPMRIDNLYQKYHAPYGVIHRADLLDRIHDAAADRTSSSLSLRARSWPSRTTAAALQCTPRAARPTRGPR